jgi:hypothetical protein
MLLPSKGKKVTKSAEYQTDDSSDILEGTMRLKSIFLALLIILVSTLAYVACGRQKLEWKGTITEKDGVVIVKNPKEPLYENSEFNIVQDLKIGQPSGKPEYMFSQITSLEVDAKGNIYAAEAKENHIRVFDKKGVYLRTVGRPGQGPGEFTFPRHVHVNPAGEIMATDEASRSVKVFSPEGNYLRQYLLKTFYPMEMDYGGGDVFYIMDFSREPPGFQLFRLDSRTEESAQLAVWAIPKMSRATVFEPIMSFAVMLDDRLLYGCPTEGYEIQIFSPQGHLEKKIIKDWDPQPVMAKEKEAILSELKKRYPSDQIQLDFPKFHPPYRVVKSDDSGRIIVHVYSEYTAEPSQKTESRFDIFDRDGRYLASFSYPFKTLIEKPMLWKAGKFYTVEQDEEGYLYIVRYTVEFKF